MNDHNFEFYLPAGAKVEQMEARAPNGQPITVEAIPQSEKNLYAVNFPLRPGETQFQLEFTLPYTGALKVDPKPLYPAEHFVVVLPKSMRFAPAPGVTDFKSMADPSNADSIVQVAQQTHPGQALGFSVSGTGTINDQPPQAGGGQSGPEAQAGSQSGPASGPMNENPQTESTRPGGGLGIPIDAPDPLEKYRWYIIGTFIVLLAIGGWIVTKRQGAVSAASGSRATLASGPLLGPITGPGAGRIAGSGSNQISGMQGGNSSNSNSGKSMLLEALKEELFQLEVERQQGKVSAGEYDKAKAALDQTLERALKRQN
jgi:hypothetical protein